MFEDGATFPTEDQPLNAPPTEETQLVTIRLNGKTLTVTPDVADALQAREGEFQRRLSQQGQELGQLRQQVQSLATLPREKASDDSDPDLDYFRQPHQTVQQQLMKVRQEIIQEVEQKYQQEKARETFWSGFYAQNPDLKAHDWVVQATLAQEWSRLSVAAPEDAAADLAAATRKRIATLAQPAGQRVDVPQGGARTARTAPPSPTAPAAPELTDESYGLADVIAARRKARYAAQLGQSHQKR